MDIKTLKSEIAKVITALQEEGKVFDFVGLTPAYPGDSQTSYIIQVSADWLNIRNPHDGLRFIVDKIFALLDKSTIRYINRVQVIDLINEDTPKDNLILINKLNYQPNLSQLTYSDY